MKVNELIRELKQMPQNLEVEVSMHDNTEYESAGEVFTVHHFIKDKFDANDMGAESRRAFIDMRAECVILRC